MDPIVAADPNFDTTFNASAGGEEESFADLIEGATAEEMEAAMADVVTLPIMLDIVMDGIQEFDE